MDFRIFYVHAYDEENVVSERREEEGKVDLIPVSEFSWNFGCGQQRSSLGR